VWRETFVAFEDSLAAVMVVGDRLVTGTHFTEGPCMISSNTEQTFGQINFAEASLGDKRRTKRLVDTADLMARRPGGTLPQKLNNPKDLKAFYR
jgi:hypothetical protein